MRPLLLLLTLAAALPARAFTIRLHCDRKSVSEGQSALFTVSARKTGGRPAAGVVLWPLLNGRRWGAPITSDGQGEARFPLPLPLPGRQKVSVGLPENSLYMPLPASWIWASHTSDKQHITLFRRFTLPSTPQKAVLFITCDDWFHAYLNGKLIGQGTDFHKVQKITGLLPLLHAGQNVLKAECYNGSGAAGLLARLEVSCKGRKIVLPTDASWSVSGEEKSASAVVVCKAGEGVWGESLNGWPGMHSAGPFYVGEPFSKGGAVSNTVTLQVRKLPRSASYAYPFHRIVMDWEPWFTPQNARWDTTEAIPVIGQYPSNSVLAARQHLLWMREAGADSVLVDWSNNLWGKKHWSEHPPGVDELVAGTDALFEADAQLKEEGLRPPQITIMIGLANGPPAAPQALEEEARFLYARYIAPARFRGLWLPCDGRPLVVVLNCAGAGYPATVPPLTMPQFTIRWMSTQLQESPGDVAAGYWSWMDGSLLPITSKRSGRAEALTITPAYFAGGGWLAPTAGGRRNGYTYLRQWREAMQVRPQFLLLNQWNEFAGQTKGEGYGPDHNSYVDCYDPEFSDDIEPTSLTDPGYRGTGGWGYFYYNMTLAAARLYRESVPKETETALAPPVISPLHPDQAEVSWTWIGKKPAGFTLELDGKRVVKGVEGSHYTMDISQITNGPHTLKLIAEGTDMSYPYSLLAEDGSPEKGGPAVSEVLFNR